MEKKLWDEPSPEILDGCQKGNESCLSRMLLAYTPLIRYIAREFSGHSYQDEEDLLQEGYISLIRAVKGYVAERGKFSSYLFSCVRNGMISYLRKNRKMPLVLSLDSGQWQLPPAEAAAAEDLLTEYFPEDVRNSLSLMETAVLDAFLQTGSVSSAAVILEFPRKKVDNALQRIRKKILERVEKDR